MAFGFATVTDASGDGSITLNVPSNPSLVGQSTYWQWASLQTGGPFAGAAQLSDGLELILGN